MHIGLIAPPWLPVPPPAYGGIESVVHTLALALREAGHEVLLAASGDSTCPVERVPGFAPSDSSTVGATLQELRHVVRAYPAMLGVDVIHDHTFLGPLYSNHAPLVPVAATVHGPFGPDVLEIYRAVPGTVSLVAISRDQASTAEGVRISRVIHHGINPAEVPVGRGRGGYVAFLGRMHPNKGVLEAIMAARRAGLPLRIGAKNREAGEHAYFNEVIRPLLRPGTEYLGELTAAEKFELLGGAIALLNPIQWSEPFGMVMIESLAAGTPVVATARGSAPEIIDDGVTGFLRTDEPGLVEALTRVGELDRARCRSAVEQRFSAARMAADHVRLYSEVLEAFRHIASPFFFGVDVRFHWGRFLGQGEGFELAGEGEDLPGQRRGLDAGEFRVHSDDGSFPHVRPGNGALVRRGRCVVFLGHFRAMARFGDELLLGQEVVREDPVEVPDLIEDGEFRRGVVAKVADQFADVGQFFCSTWAPSLLCLALDRVKVIFCSVQYRKRCSLMNSEPLSESMPMIGNGNTPITCWSASNTHLAALFCTERFTVHPVAMSVTVKVKQNSPLLLPPSWPTRSISTNPGTASSQSAQVRIGIWDFSSVPGFVWDRPRDIIRARSGASLRSIVAALIRTSRAASASLRTSSPSRRSSGTNTASIGASRLPAGARNTAQHVTNGDDRFRHCLRNCEKRVEDAGLSRKRSLQKISANSKRTDFALAA